MSPAEIVSEPAADGLEVWKFRLYVRGQASKSITALENLKRLCETHLTGRYEIEVIDLAEHPSLARSADILAVPTLVRHLPAPMRKVIGDLSDIESVLLGLRLGGELT